jgi:aminoglycoside phosphotransferase (APT) family kinase protein
MLWPDDARLVERDRGLPGLGVVLDPEAVVDWLRRHGPDTGVRDARPQYVRYKPGTSCLVTYAVEATDGSAVLTVKAYRPPALDKLAKAARLRANTSLIGPAAIVSEDSALSATVLPYDVKLRRLSDLLGPRPEKVLDDLLPGRGEAPRLHILSYKPERRAVVRVDWSGGSAVVRVYAAREYASGAGRRIVGRPAGVQLAWTLALHPSYPVTATEWLDGDDGTTAFGNPDRASAIGDALARLHGAPCTASWTRSTDDDRRRLRDVVRGLADVLPAYAARLNHLAGVLEECLVTTNAPALTHGDFAARQTVFTACGVALTDLDEAAAGDPAADVGSFLADIEYQVMSGELDQTSADCSAAGFLEGYARVRSMPGGVEAHLVAQLLRLAPMPFRARMPDWQRRIEQVITRCEWLASRAPVVSRISRGSPLVRRLSTSANSTEEVDPAIPWLAAALDPLRVTPMFAELPWAVPGSSVRAVHVIRHKRGRRCLLQYDMTGPIATALGKTRAKGLDVRTARVNELLRSAGFGEGSADAIEVPPFLGLVPPLRMWLQGAVSGQSASVLLSQGDRHLARRVIDLIAKIQRHGPLPGRTHTIADECRILEGRLGACADRHPKWRERLARLLEGCESLAGKLLDTPLVPAHRDLHPDQVLVAGSRLVLLDLDLYTLAHPALDAGNCLAHVMELGLRPGAISHDVDEAAFSMRDAMAATLPLEVVPAIDVFTTLTLARLIDIADRVDHRRVCVEPLVALCEKRLTRAKALRPLRSKVHAPSGFMRAIGS